MDILKEKVFEKRIKKYLNVFFVLFCFVTDEHCDVCICQQSRSSLAQIMACIFHQSRSSFAQIMAWIFQQSRSSLAQIMACCLFSDKPLSDPNIGLFSIGPLQTIFSEIQIRGQQFLYKQMHLKLSPAKWQPFCVSMNDIKDKSMMWFLDDNKQ